MALAADALQRIADVTGKTGIENRKRPRITIQEIADLADYPDELGAHPAIQPDNRSRLTKFFDFIDLPRDLVGNAIGSLVGMPDDPKRERGAFGLPKIFMSDVLGHLGVENRAIKAIAGFVGDVAIDPLTYVGGGASVIKKGAVKIHKSGQKAIGAAAMKAAEGIRPTGSLGMMFEPKLLETLKTMDKVAAQDQAARHIENIVTNHLAKPGHRGEWARSFAEEYGVKGSALFHIPFTSKEFVRLPFGKGIKLQNLIRNVQQPLKDAKRLQRAASTTEEGIAARRALEAALEPLTGFVRQAAIGPELLGKRIRPALAKALGDDVADFVTGPMNVVQQKGRDIFGTAFATPAEQVLKQGDIAAGATQDELVRQLMPERMISTGQLVAGAPGTEGIKSVQLGQAMMKEMPGRFKDVGAATSAGRQAVLAEIEKRQALSIPQAVEKTGGVTVLRNQVDTLEKEINAGWHGDLPNPKQDELAMLKDELKSARELTEERIRKAPQNILVEKQIGIDPKTGEEVEELIERYVPDNEGIRAALGTDFYNMLFDPQNESLAATIARKQASDLMDTDKRLRAIAGKQKMLAGGMQEHFHRVIDPTPEAASHMTEGFKGDKWERMQRGALGGASQKRTTWVYLEDAANPSKGYHWEPEPGELANLQHAKPNGIYMPVSQFHMNDVIAPTGEFDDIFGAGWGKHVQETGAKTWIESPFEQLLHHQLAIEPEVARREFMREFVTLVGEWLPRKKLQFPDRNAPIHLKDWVNHPEGISDIGKVVALDKPNKRMTVEYKFAVADEEGGIEQMVERLVLPEEGAVKWQNASGGIKDVVVPPDILERYIGTQADELKESGFEGLMRFEVLNDLDDQGIVAFPREHAYELNRLADVFMNPQSKELPKALDWLWKANSVSKMVQLLGVPYPIINAVGDLMNMMLVAKMGDRLSDYKRIGQAYQAMWAKHIRGGDLSAIDSLFKPIKTDGGRTVPWSTIVKKAEERGIHKSSISTEVREVYETELRRKAMDNMPFIERTQVRRALDKVGDVAGYPFRKFFDFNAMGEEARKLATFAAMVERGNSFDEAMAIANRALIDYTRASAAEAKYAIPMFGFYRWVRNATAIQLQQLMTHPAYAAVVPKLQKALSVEEPMDPALMQDYVRDLQSSQVTGGTEGGTFLTTLNLLPQNELQNILNPAKSFTNALSPLTTTLISIGTGRETFTGRQIGAEGEPGVEVTPGQYLTNQLRTLRDINRVRKSEAGNWPAGILLGGRAQPRTRESGLNMLDKQTTDALRDLRARIKRRGISDEERATIARKILETYTKRMEYGLDVPKVTRTILGQQPARR